MDQLGMTDAAKPKDEAGLKRYREVLLRFGLVTDYIQWKKLPQDWLGVNFPNVTAKLVHKLMVKHAESNGKIDQVPETRPEYSHWPFHYDLRISILGRRVYIETRFGQEQDVEECTISVVNIHDA